jgi:RHS repeat-associated protein
VWGLQEIGQRSAGVATYAHMDGTGSVRLLTDTAGTPVARRDFDVYGMPRASSGAATSVYQYAGEYRDETIGMQYHRARWYQPELGRFATMDVVDGVRKQPVTQNKYVYAGDNPVANSDPSGAFLVSQAYAMEIMASVYTIPTASYIGLTAGLAGRVALYAAASALGTYVVVDQASKQNMEECMQSSFSGQNKCKPDFAMFILGDDYDEVREHVGSALSDGQPSFLSRRAPPHKRDWMKTGTVGRCLKSSLTNCDEYPWAAAIEGGEHNNVSLRSVNGSQNKGAGSTLRWFHEKCKIPANTPAVKYKVLAVKGIARTGYVCQR